MPNRIATHAIFALLAALLLATPGRAADVVAVRVGDHPTYTRVVFQLDAPAGYGIERRTAEDGTSEILVRMDAGSTPRSLDRRTVMVERISVEGGQDRSTARIRLRKSPSRVRELILTNPPRLTFDLVFPEPMLAAAKRRTAEKAALAQAPGAEPDPKAAPPSSAGKPTLKADVLPGAKPTLKADVPRGAKPTLKADVPRGAKPDVPGTPGRAADVVAVRVGNHPTYTRVVFQLDAPAGYGIERRTAEDGTSEILVRMDAGSTPRSLDRRTVMVERISVEEGQDRSTARIRLRKNPSRVRELILTNPPRLAFDLVFPEPMLAAAKRRTAEKAALAQAPGAEPDPKAAPPSSAGKPTLKADVLPGVKPTLKADVLPGVKPTLKADVLPGAKPTLKADVPRGVKPTLKADVPRGAKPTLKADVLPGVKPTAEAVVPPGAKPEVLPGAKPTAKAVVPPGVKPEVLPGAKPTAKAVVPPGVKPEVLPGVKPTAEAVVPPGAKPRAKADVLPGVKPTASADVDWVFYGSFLAGGILLAIFVATWLRRRSLPSDVEVTAVANSVAADDRREIAATDGDSEASEATPEMPRAGFAGVEVDVARRLLEFERRVEQVEARLDTSSDARERLERQVAAQGEELRVQRSAIARTQRALRSLSRGDAEEATEPARRDGDS